MWMRWNGMEWKMALGREWDGNDDGEGRKIKHCSSSHHNHRILEITGPARHEKPRRLEPSPSELDQAKLATCKDPHPGPQVQALIANAQNKVLGDGRIVPGGVELKFECWNQAGVEQRALNSKCVVDLAEPKVKCKMGELYSARRSKIRKVDYNVRHVENSRSDTKIFPEGYIAGNTEYAIWKARSYAGSVTKTQVLILTPL
ncbi:hypothetical protein F4604DRAFT_1684586 [Suillus subluteus]|nr:hypothetical protein F4604DRAFT_1684586 [Suillus subluteus]